MLRSASILTLTIEVFLLLLIAYVTIENWSRGYADIHLYLDAAQQMHNLSSPYSILKFQRSYLYSPAFALIFMPLLALETHWAMSFWMMTHFLLLVLLIWELCNWSKIRSLNSRIAFAAFCLLFCFLPVVSEIQEGQVNILIVTLIAFALRNLENNRSLLASLLMAMAIIIKLQVLALVVPLLILGRFRICVYIIAWLIILLMVPPTLWYICQNGITGSIVWGIEVNSEYFSKIVLKAITGNVAGREEFYISNYSLGAVVSRLFLADIKLHPYQVLPYMTPLLAEVSVKVVKVFLFVSKTGLLLTALIPFLLHRTSKKLPTRSLVIFYILIQICSPTFWEHHMVSLLLIAPILFLDLREKGGNSKAFAPFILVLISTTVVYLPTLIGYVLGEDYSQLLIFVRVYGLVLPALLLLLNSAYRLTPRS